MQNKTFEKCKILLELSKLLELLENNKSYPFINFIDMIIENGGACISIIFKDNATFKNMQNFYNNDLLVLLKLFNKDFIKIEFDYAGINLNIEGIDELDYREYIEFIGY